MQLVREFPQDPRNTPGSKVDLVEQDGLFGKSSTALGSG